MSYMLKYDSAQGKWPGTVSAGDGCIIVDGHSIQVTGEKDPSNIPWAKGGAEYIVRDGPPPRVIFVFLPFWHMGQVATFML